MNSSSSRNQVSSDVDENCISYPNSSSPRIQNDNDNFYSDTRLFVSNLSGSVSEHDLLTLFRPLGFLKKLDLIFHKNGPLKGQPKGYAFIEYCMPHQAQKAKSTLDGKSVRGKEMHIGFAKVENLYDRKSSVASHGAGPHRKSIERSKDVQQRSNHSNGNKSVNRNDSTNSRIAAIEAKLESMRNKNKSDSSHSLTNASIDQTKKKSNSLPERPRHLPPKH